MRAAWLIVPSLLMLGACGDPLRNIERVTDDTLDPDSVVASALPTRAELEREGSILSGLFRKKAEPETSRAEIGPTDPDAVEDTVEAIPSVEPTSARKGILGWLRRAPDSEQVTLVALPDGVAADEDMAEGTDVSAVLEAEDQRTTPDANAANPGNGKRVTRPAEAAGMALRDVALGEELPFGEVARVCDVAKRDLGKQVERSEPRKSGYALYDSAPDSAAPRSFYVTGFSDSCVRQFTASLAVFGTPAFHEQLRYGLPADEYPYSTTDRAYEKVKAKLCNVGRNKPCGARISRLEGSTAFVSVYEHFGENARWADMLLHDGALLATAMKTP